MIASVAYFGKSDFIFSLFRSRPLCHGARVGRRQYIGKKWWISVALSQGAGYGTTTYGGSDGPVTEDGDGLTGGRWQQMD